MADLLKKTTILLIVILFWPLVFVVSFIQRKRRVKQKSILIINNAKIGDMVCASPVFRAVKANYPNSRLILLINPKTKGIVVNNPHIDNIISINQKFSDLFFVLRKENASMAVSMIPGTFNYLLPYFLCIPIRSVATAPEYGFYYRTLAYLCSTTTSRLYPNTLSVKFYLELLRPLGIFDSNLKKEVFINKTATEKVVNLFKSNDLKRNKFIGFSLTAGNRMKEWPPKRFIELSLRIYKKYNLVPIFFGTKSDREYIETYTDRLVNEKVPFIVATELMLEELPLALSLLSYFVSVDTGTLYIANALDIPVVDIAGPCNIYDQIPIYEKCEVVYVKDLPGWPYSSVLKTVDWLTEDQMKSILNISVDDVLKAFEILYSKYDKN